LKGEEDAERGKALSRVEGGSTRAKKKVPEPAVWGKGCGEWGGEPGNRECGQRFIVKQVSNLKKRPDDPKTLQ